MANKLALDGGIGFYGAPPAAQFSVLSAITTAQPTITVYGFQTTAQMNNLIAAVNSLISNMQTLGLMATS